MILKIAGAILFVFFVFCSRGSAEDSHAWDPQSVYKVIDRLDAPTFAERQHAHNTVLEMGFQALTEIRNSHKTDNRREVRYRLKIINREIRSSQRYPEFRLNGTYSGSFREILERIDKASGLRLFGSGLIQDEATTEYTFNNTPLWRGVLDILYDASLHFKYSQEGGFRIADGRLAREETCIAGPFLFIRIPSDNDFETRVLALFNDSGFTYPVFDDLVRVRVKEMAVHSIFGKELDHSNLRQLMSTPVFHDGVQIGFELNIRHEHSEWMLLQLRTDYRIRADDSSTMVNTNMFDLFWFEVEFGLRNSEK